MKTPSIRRYEYRPIGHHLNDFTFIRKDDRWHLFHITGRGPKASPGLAGEHVGEGHATTTDFIHWQEEPIIPQTRAACYVVAHQGRYALISGLRSICWSDDLCQWTAETPLRFTNDPAPWYERQTVPEEGRYISPRDPFICRNPETGRYVMLFCDRVPEGDLHNRGCVGAAESSDLVTWTFLPPVFGPRHFYCESPHLVFQGGKHHLFFSLSPECSVRHAVSKCLLGPYQETEEGDILPGYHGAGDAIECDGQWLYFGRIMEREERRRHGRLFPGRLSLPVRLTFDERDRCCLAPYDRLARLREELVVDGFRDGWSIHHGDWKFNAQPVPAQNLSTQVPAGAVLGSAYFDEAQLDSNGIVDDFDLECTLQLPTFATGSTHFRAGLILRGGLRLELDALLSTAILSDCGRTVLCTAPLRDFQLDRYYGLRVIFLGDFIQVYLDNRLLMYLCAYGPARGTTSLSVWQGDAIFASLRIHRMPRMDPIPIFPGGEPLRPELP